MRNIPEHESLTVEFKSDRKRLSDDILIESVVAFSNTDGGALYLGVEDDGTATGLHKDHQNITTLGAFIANKTVPPVAVRLEMLEGEVKVLRIEVPKSRSIVSTSSGKILRRRLKADGTPENVPMYPYEITGRLSSLSMLDYSAQPLYDASCEDFDPLERERLRNIILSYRGEQTLLELSNEELDKALRLVTEEGGKLFPTIAGMLLLGRARDMHRFLPTNAAAFQVLMGSEVKVNETFELPLLAAFEKMSDYMNAWNQEQEMEIGLFRISIPDFDKRAFREALVNAFSHRDYSMLGRVRLMLDENGLTLSNPGGFIEGVNQKNLLSVEPHGRNPALADALKRIGLAERTGRGVDRIYEGSLYYGRPLPDYSETTETMVKLYIPRGVPDKAFVRMISEEQQRQGYPLPINSLLVLNVLREMRRANIQEIAQQINMSLVRAKPVVERLTETGMVEAYGTGRGRQYLLSSKLYRQSDHDMAYVRQTDIDQLRYAELVVKLAAQRGVVTRSDVAELLHVTPPQAHRILQRLVRDGQLTPAGEKRGRKYYPKHEDD